MYKLTDWMRHVDQCRTEQEQWIGNGFKTERERLAFQAGHSKGAQDSRNLIVMHGGFKFDIDK